MRAVEGVVAGLQQDEGDAEAAAAAFQSLQRSRPFSDFCVYRVDTAAMRSENLAYSALISRAHTLLRADERDEF